MTARQMFATSEGTHFNLCHYSSILFNKQERYADIYSKVLIKKLIIFTTETDGQQSKKGD
jgi:hypothetical protein